MNNPAVTVINKSSNKKINVSLKSPEDAVTPEPSDSFNLEPQSTNRLSYNNSTANLFIWDGDTHDMIWQGIIPTKSQNSIDIFPEEKKVIFSGIEIPDNFKNTTVLPTTKKNTHSYYLYFIVIIVIVLILLALWYNSTKKEK